MRQQGRTDGFDGERVATWALVVVVHLALVWGLTRPLPPQGSLDAAPLQIHWIERAMSRPHPPPPEAPASARSQAARPAPTAQDTRISEVHAPEPAAAVREEVGALSAVFLEQGRRWVEDAAPIGNFQSNPLAVREDLIALPRTDRFRMRDPVTPERVVQAVGVLFGGADYSTDPCPRVRRNLANLATGSDRALVEEEVRRHRQFCQ
jgi:hypothetical protein